MAAPSWLSADAKREWNRLAKSLTEAGLLTSADRTSFAMYCQSYGDYLAACRSIKKDGPTIATPNGNVIQNPAVWDRNKAWDQMLKMGKEFGLTPSSRSGVVTDDAGNGGQTEAIAALLKLPTA